MPTETADAVVRRFGQPGNQAVRNLQGLLSVCDGSLRLSLSTHERGLAPALELDLAESWLVAVSQAFDLTLDSAGQLTARRCLINLVESPETLILELRPQSRRTVVALPGQRIRAAWRTPLASIAVPA